VLRHELPRKELNEVEPSFSFRSISGVSVCSGTNNSGRRIMRWKHVIPSVVYPGYRCAQARVTQEGGQRGESIAASA
jgi:hypothetical protein